MDTQEAMNELAMMDRQAEWLRDEYDKVFAQEPSDKGCERMEEIQARAAQLRRDVRRLVGEYQQ